MADSIFNERGHPGEWIVATTMTSGSSMIFTGSNYGAAGIIRGSGASGSIGLTGGGTVSVEDLNAGSIHKLSIRSVSAVDGGTIYILRRG